LVTGGDDGDGDDDGGGAGGQTMQRAVEGIGIFVKK